MKKGLAVLLGAISVIGVAAAFIVFQRGAGGPQSVSAAGPPATSGSIVVDWNQELIRIVAAPGAQPATVHPTRSFAILHAAIYDAVVSTTPGSGSPYLFSINAPRGARSDAAAAEAGHDSLLALYPTMQSSLDQQLAAELAVIPNGAAKDQGIRVGHLAAQLMLAARADDGSAVKPPVLPAGTEPGQYRPTPPAFAAAAFTQWGNVTPFVVQRADQFRPAAPPDLTSSAYAQAINEVKDLGRDTSTVRTSDQTEVARFWPGPIWVSWNEIAENAATQHHGDLVHTAQLFALLNLAFADTTIAFYDAKYTYKLWRPITAIREADGAGNPAVSVDRAWNPLIPTAPDPSYPGAHSAISAAGAAVLASFYGDRGKLTVTSDSLPGVTRSFDSYSTVATEAGLSRIYGGVHTRLDHDAGLKLGAAVAELVLHDARSPAFGD